MSRVARGTFLIGGTLLGLGGCAVVAPVGGMPVGEARPGGPATECDGAQLAFAGQATLAEVGLTDFIGPDDAGRRGFIQITAVPIVPENVPGRPAEPGRWVCVQWLDGSGMAGTIPDDWQLPEGVVNDPVVGDSGEDGLPVLSIALLALAAAAAGITFVAFRGERSS